MLQLISLCITRSLLHRSGKKKSLPSRRKPSSGNKPGPDKPPPLPARRFRGIHTARTNAIYAAGCVLLRNRNAPGGSTNAAGRREFTNGAAVEIRTQDLFLTKEVLYLLSYSSIFVKNSHQRRGRWWESSIKHFSAGMST